MTTIILENSKAKEFEKLINKSKGNYKSIKNKLQNWIYQNPNNQCIDIARYIKNNLKKIITETPKGLDNIIKDFEARGYQDRIFNPNARQLTAFGEDLKKIFNYKNFRKSKKAIWFADTINIRSCSTCNTQYTLRTNQLKGDKLLFHLDHYFPQSIYPYLSLSYYNLLPCCASCNMSKSNKPFKISENIHPYIESFHEIAKFKVNKESLIDFLINPWYNEKKISYKVEIRAKYYGNQPYEIKLKNYLEEFRINEQYIQFKDIAAEIFLKSKYYNRSKRKELKKFFNQSNIPINDELINRFILGNYTQNKDLLKRPLAKFMKDIGEEVNLI